MKKKYGGLVIRKIESPDLPVRRLGGGASFNFSLITAISWQTSLCQRMLPWSFIVNLTKQEAEQLAREMLRTTPDCPEVVISKVTVKGETAQAGMREYYQASELWLWNMAGVVARLHEEVGRITRSQKEVTSGTDEESKQNRGRKSGRKPGGRRGSARAGRERGAGK